MRVNGAAKLRKFFLIPPISIIESVDFFLWAWLHCTGTALLTITTYLAALFYLTCVEPLHFGLTAHSRKDHSRGERSPSFQRCSGHLLLLP